MIPLSKLPRGLLNSENMLWKVFSFSKRKLSVTKNNYTTVSNYIARSQHDQQKIFYGNLGPVV